MNIFFSFNKLQRLWTTVRGLWCCGPILVLAQCRGHPQATQSGITDKQPDQSWDTERFRGPENRNSNDSLRFPCKCEYHGVHCFSLKCCSRTWWLHEENFLILKLREPGVGDKRRDSIIKSANLIIAILLRVLLRAGSRYRQNRQLPMATDCWWNQRAQLCSHLSLWELGEPAWC